MHPTKGKPLSGRPAGFYFMKITIETNFVIATVESKRNYASELMTEVSEAKELFKYALLGVGFNPETIKEAFNENPD